MVFGTLAPRVPAHCISRHKPYSPSTRPVGSGVRVLAAAEGSSVPARLSPPPLSVYGRGQPQPVSSRMVWRCQNSGPRRRKQRFAGGTRFLAPRRLARRDSRLKLGPSATCDGPRHSGSSPEGAKTHPRSLRSSSAVVHRCRYAPMVRRAESLKLPGDKTLAIAVAVSLVLFAWGLIEFVRSL